MPTQYRFPLHPAGAKEVNEVLAIHEAKGQVAYFAAGVPVFTHAADDPVGRRFAAVQLVELGLAEQTELAPALGLHRATIHRCRRKVQAAGGLGLVAPRPPPPAPAPGGPRQRSDQDAASPGGIAVQRQAERALAATGRLAEAPPRFAAAEAVQGAGVLCALPALLQHGLLAVGEHVYGRLRNGFYGLRSGLLTLAGLALLRGRTSEQLQGHAPGDLGRFLGLDRVPEVKTLRRKLGELADRRQAHAFHRGLAERWIAQAPDAIGFLYIDGHVRPYHGHAHRLPEAHVARRRLCLPATTDFYVNDQAAAPGFLVTAPAHDGVVPMLATGG